MSSELRGARASGRDVPHQLADTHPERPRPSRTVAVPEGHLSRLPGRGRHDDTVMSDLLGTPRRGPQEKDLALPELEDHLFVELAHAPPSGLRGVLGSGVAVRREDAIEPPVGDRSPARDGEALRARAGA